MAHAVASMAHAVASETEADLIAEDFVAALTVAEVVSTAAEGDLMEVRAVVLTAVRAEVSATPDLDRREDRWEDQWADLWEAQWAVRWEVR